MKKKQDIKFIRKRRKVCSKFFSRMYDRYVIFPEINLSGKWLQDHGFNCGDYVEVELEKDKIIITRRANK